MISASLIADGSSDQVLIPILQWLVSSMTSAPFLIRWADLRSRQSLPKTLADRVREALHLYPCDLLFVHRDAEQQPAKWRYEEIAAAVPARQRSIAVVPVRMQEAWLLHNERALRKAAGRPSGTQPLHLPALSRIERLPDPKGTLHTALRAAADVTGRRLRGFNSGRTARRLAELIEDWTPLQQLPAFAQLVTDTQKALRGLDVALTSPD